MSSSRGFDRAAGLSAGVTDVAGESTDSPFPFACARAAARAAFSCCLLSIRACALAFLIALLERDVGTRL